MYAVIKTGGKQHRVVVDELLKVELLKAEKGETIKAITIFYTNFLYPKITLQPIGEVDEYYLFLFKNIFFILINLRYESFSLYTP